MVDTVRIDVLYESDRTYLVRLSCLSDGTGESGVIKIDKSGLTVGGAEPTLLTVDQIVWTIQGFTSVALDWDHTTDDNAFRLAGGNYLNFEDIGGFPDPASSGGSGDLLLTSVGAVDGATYDIFIKARKIA